MNNRAHYYMNINTGSVDTQENWIADGADADDFGSTLVQVELEDGSQIPADFEPAYSNDYNWVEA